MMESLKKSVSLAWFIIKIVIPIYILADILYFYNVLSYISFLLEPFCSLLNLPPEASLAIVSGMFLNLYAAIAFAAPLDLSIEQWTILAIFLGVCHSLIIENIIMQKLGIPRLFSYSLRFLGGIIIAYSATWIPSSWFASSYTSKSFESIQYDSLGELLINSFSNSVILTLKIIALITVLVFIMNYIKSLSFVQKSGKKVSKYFSLLIGVFLGITYGAGLLINESNNLEKKDILYIGTFLMICHSVIEDTLLFVIFGADFTIIVIVRTLWAIILAYGCMKIYELNIQDRKKQQLY